jgi:hypothetical protein
MSRGRSRRTSRSRTSAARIVIAIIVVAAAGFGFVELDLTQVLTGGSETDGGTTPVATSRDLDGLEVAPAGSMTGYSR